MPDDCNELKRKLSERYKEAVEEFEPAFRDGIEVPSPIEDKYDLAASKYEEANKKFSEVGEKAAKELKNAIDCSEQALVELLKFLLSDAYQKACDARKSFEGYEYIASAHIKNYSEHTVNFRRIEEFMEKCKSPDIGLSHSVRYHTSKLNSFLFDFASVKEVISSEINKEKDAKRRFWIGIGVTIAIAVSTLIVSIIGLKGCSDSSQQTSQPEVTVSEAEP